MPSAATLQQQIRFCHTKDGVRLAYAIVGKGPPLVKASNWLSHVEFDWRSPVWHPFLEQLARNRTVIRYDERGNGLSDWDVVDLSFESWVRDLEAVVERSGSGGSHCSASRRAARSRSPTRSAIPSASATSSSTAPMRGASSSAIRRPPSGSRWTRSTT